MKMRNKDKCRNWDEVTFTKQLINQPGSRMHLSILESALNYLKCQEKTTENSLEIIEVGAGYGLLARMLLSRIAIQFPKLEIHYTGIEIDPDRILHASGNLKSFRNVTMDCKDYFHDVISNDKRSSSQILVSTGLIQSLDRDEIYSLLSLQNSKENFFGIIGFPYNYTERGDPRIHIGNEGAKEFGYSETYRNIQSVASELMFENTSLELVEAESTLQIVFSYESIARKIRP
jgi:hypothetical protein